MAFLLNCLSCRQPESSDGNSAAKGSETGARVRGVRDCAPTLSPVAPDFVLSGPSVANGATVSIKNVLSAYNSAQGAASGSAPEMLPQQGTPTPRAHAAADQDRSGAVERVSPMQMEHVDDNHNGAASYSMPVCPVRPGLVIQTAAHLLRSFSIEGS